MTRAASHTLVEAHRRRRCEAALDGDCDAVRCGGVVKASSGNRVIGDTTVTPKAIAHPTGGWLLQRSRQHLEKAAEEQGLNLRQSLQPHRPEAGRADRALCPGQAVQAHAPRRRTLRVRMGRVPREVACPNLARCPSRHEPRSATCSHPRLASSPGEGQEQAACLVRSHGRVHLQGKAERPTSSA